MATKHGSYERVGIYKETTRGTAPVEKLHVMPLLDRGFDLFDDAPTAVSELNGTPVPAQPGRGVISAAGTVTVPVDEAGIGLWFHTFLSSYAHAGAGDPYTHTWLIAASDPTSFGVELGNTSASKFDVIPGCAVRGIRIDVDKSAGLAQFTVDLIGGIAGAPTLNAVASVDAAPSTYTTTRYSLFPSVFKIGGVASTLAQKCSLDIRRDVNVVHVLDGNRYPAQISFGNFTISGSVTGVWDDADTLRALAIGAAGAAGAEQSLEIDLASSVANRDLKLYMDECACYLGSAPGLGGRGARSITINFQAYYTNDADAPIKVVLRNATADYDAIWIVG